VTLRPCLHNMPAAIAPEGPAPMINTSVCSVLIAPATTFGRSTSPGWRRPAADHAEAKQKLQSGAWYAVVAVQLAITGTWIKQQEHQPSPVRRLQPARQTLL